MMVSVVMSSATLEPCFNLVLLICESVWCVSECVCAIFQHLILLTILLHPTT